MTLNVGIVRSNRVGRAPLNESTGENALNVTGHTWQLDGPPGAQWVQSSRNIKGKIDWLLCSLAAQWVILADDVPAEAGLPALLVPQAGQIPLGRIEEVAY